MSRKSRPASSASGTSAAHGSDSKRPRKDDSDPADPNARLLAHNKFSTLPVDQNPKREKLPPIFTASKEVAALRTELAAKQIFPLFKLCRIGTKIVCSTSADYKEVGNHLKEKKHEFFSHDAPGSKPLKVLLHGLPEFTPEEIIGELRAANLKPLNVFPIRRHEGVHRDRIYLVHLEKNSVNMADLRKVRALFQVIVEWEKYHPKKRDATQCGNCLAFGHGARNCHMLPRCGKCAGRHPTDSCTSMDEGADPQCANCGDKHEGFNRGCPKRAEFIEIRKKASAKNQRGRDRRPPRPPPESEEHFPQLRYQVPNLPPLQPNHQAQRLPARGDPRPSAQQRLSAAAAAPSRSTPPPGWGNQERNNPPVDPLDDGTRFPTQAIMGFAQNLFERLLSCRSKRDQINAVCETVQDFINKYGP